ncbi:hypothetical protein ACLI09_03435 [Flavobacterium sp. RHBU_24]|uniref:hypothetical protein n=1 Tax=Flavobacterium sp. RHBU_24 TaxID=3391185 RepID=UPI003984C49C
MQTKLLFFVMGSLCVCGIPFLSLAAQQFLSDTYHIFFTVNQARPTPGYTLQKNIDINLASTKTYRH